MEKDASNAIGPAAGSAPPSPPPPPPVLLGYASPFSAAESTEPKPPYKLYSTKAVGLATFLGAPLAGAAVMAINYRRLGRKRAAWRALTLGVLGTGAITAIALAVPDSWPRSAAYAPSLVGFLAMLTIADSLQGPDLKEHARRRGDKASLWKAAGIGLASMALVLVIAVGIVFLTSEDLGKKINVTAVEEVYYTKQATRTDAVQLGDLLKAMGFFTGQHEKTVVLRRTSESTTVAFVVSDGAWDRPEIIGFFRTVGEKVADLGWKKPVVIQLCDPHLNVKKEIKIE